MNTTLCPSCGSDQLKITTRNESLPIVYGRPAEWTEIVAHCLVCDESGDFSGENDSKIEKAIDKAKKQSVKSMLDSLSAIGLTMAYLERALELSPRTIARWKAGKSSASSITLLRIIRTFPWIVDIADHNYDSLVAQSKLVEEALKAVHSSLMPFSQEPRINVISNNGMFHFSATYPYNNVGVPQVSVNIEG